MTHHTMADHVFRLNQVQPQHRPFIGENAYQLGMALQKQCPVLPGIVVSTVFFDEFLESVDWADPLLADLPHSSLHIDVDNPLQLQAIAQRIQQSVFAHKMVPDHQATICNAVQALDSPLVLVRPLLVLRQSVSSPSVPASHTLPNLTSTDLPHHLLPSQISRNDPTELIKTIRQIWTSFFQASHLFYWQRLGVPFRHLQLALLIQPAISSIAAGTAHVTKDFVDITASWGLVHGVQTGDIIPDRYYTYEDSQVTHQHIGGKRYAYALQVPGERTQDLASKAVPETGAESPIPPSSLSAWEQPDAADLPTDYLCRHLLSEQVAQQVVLTDTIQAHIHQLSHELRKMVGIALHVEWSIHARSPKTPPFNPALSWTPPTHQQELRHQELARNLAQEKYVIQVTYLFPKKQKGHVAPPPNMISIPATIPPAGPAIPATQMTDSESLVSDHGLSAPKPPAPSASSTSQRPSSLPHPILKGLGASGGSVTAPVWVIQEVSQLAGAESINHCIIVTRCITFSWFNAIRNVQGVVSEQGGMTSHGAILARDVGIPAVVGVAEALTHLKTGDWVMLDGDRGTITPIPPPSDSSKIFSKISPTTPAGTTVSKTKAAEPAPITPATQLMLSLSQTDQLDLLAQLPVNGVGLIRSELMITPMLQSQSLQQWLQPDQGDRFGQTLAILIQQFAQAFAPRPIWYRTLDLRSHEYPQAMPTLSFPEPNPLLGYHGPMSYQLDSTLFFAELKALKQVQDNGLDNVNILLPFVRTVEEFQFCHEAIQQTGWLDHGNGQVWIMAEVPSVLFLLPDYVAAGVQGIAIGSNDLNHLILAIDRTIVHPHQTAGPANPAVLRAIQTLISTARKANIPCTLCGDLASQSPELIESFIRWGITALSVEPNVVEQVHAHIRQAEWQLFREWQRDRFSQNESLGR
ncbi:MAG: putative PEP-binding protein [Leptolyngbyaceae cyanobacterium]